MGAVQFLDKQNIDWDNYEESAQKTRHLVKHLATSSQCLQELIDSSKSDSRLRSMCETHQLLDYLVLYDNQDNGIRVRLHMSTSSQRQRPHDHRFDFSSYVICGSYEHVWYSLNRDVYVESDVKEAIKYQDRLNPDPNITVGKDCFKPSFIRQEVKQSNYSISHSVIHSVEMEKDTVSLIIRSPERKVRSFIFDSDTEKLWWRFGAKDESKSRRNDKVMSDLQYNNFLNNLRRLSII